MKEIIKALNWRYAVKKFDETKLIDNDTIDSLLETLRLSPSSYGLQPWKFIVVKNKEIREKLKGAAYGQGQITDASHLLVLAVRKDINEAYVDSYISSIASTRGIEVEKLEGLSKMIKGSISGMSQNDLLSWSTHQVYLALGVLIASCAIEGIDACPMEGFDRNEFDKILDLPNQNLESRAVVAIGFRSKDDGESHAPKVRFSKEEIFIELN